MGIFMNNTTKLGESKIPMAEGYDCSTGTALALIDGARNDLAMFEAMLSVEAKAIQINNSSNGVVRESQIQALTEATLGGIWAKIVEFVKKVIAKIKAIFHTFMSKVNALFMKDKELIKKYGPEVRRKSNIGKLEVKWRKFNKTMVDQFGVADGEAFDPSLVNEWDEDAEKRRNNIAKKLAGLSDADNIYDDLMEKVFEDDSATKYELNEVGGISFVISFLEESDKTLRDLKKDIDKFATKSEKTIKGFDDKARDAAKKIGTASDDKADADSMLEKEIATNKMKEAQKTFECATVWQDIVIKINQVALDTFKIIYKQCKGAFMKAIAANNDKLSESTILLDAIAEAAEEEVDEVIEKAIDGSEVDTFEDAEASENVLDAGVSNDPDKNDADYVKKAEDSYDEAAFFAASLY